MKHINKEEFSRLAKTARVVFGFNYLGESNHMQMTAKINGMKVNPNTMSDEQLVLLWQLVFSVEEDLTSEQIRRNLLPGRIRDLLEGMDKTNDL